MCTFYEIQISASVSKVSLDTVSTACLHIVYGSFHAASDGKGFACNGVDPGLIPGSGRSPKKGMATSPAFLPGEFYGQKSMVGCNPRGPRELDVTEKLPLSLLWQLSRRVEWCQGGSSDPNSQNRN